MSILLELVFVVTTSLGIKRGWLCCKEFDKMMK